MASPAQVGSTHAASSRRSGRALSWEEKAFGLSVGLIGAHLLVVTVTSPSSHLAAATAVAGPGLGPLAFLLFGKRGRALRAALAGTLGLGAAAIGLAHHAARLTLGGGHADDYSGALVGIAGIVLVVVAFHAAFRQTRWPSKLLGIPVALALLQWFVLPVTVAGVATNSPGRSVPSAASLGLHGAREVSFPARDGVKLSGWYVPGTNGAAVLLMHGSHGTRAATLGQLRMLARAGYSVLAFDARGHGRSGGETNALGWKGDDDVAGAVRYARRQPGVSPERIAALGLSMGAEEALRAAADGVPLAAVAADGAGASTTGDERLVSASSIPLSVSWVTMRATEVFSGDAEPAPLKDRVSDIRVPVLLIASNAPHEYAIDGAFAARIGPRARLWHVADAAHTRAFFTHPGDYRARVTKFLQRALSR